MPEQRPPGHVLSGYWDVLEIRARDLRAAARTAGRERGLWLASWRFVEDASCERPELVWRASARVPLLEVLRVYLPEIRALAARYGVSRVRVYGSAARGEDTAGSDIDVLVDLPRGHGARPLADFAADVGEVVGRHVDVVTGDVLRPDVLAAVLRDAVDLI